MSMKKLLSRVAENLSVRRAFGTPYESGDLMVIPVAFVAGGGGVGEGQMAPGHEHAHASGGSGPRPFSPGESDVSPPEGSGAGFGGVVVPAGVYVVQGDEVRWEPAVNVTLIAIAGLGVLRLLLRLVARVRIHRGASD
jgi:uncharacterized spore protein YtfJ